jgi:F-type H+-transporting ATPase subunit epsilon
MSTIRVDVVSAEQSIFSGEAKFVALPGENGELGILRGHTPLITRIRPGSVRIEKADGDEEFVFVAGGYLEVQPDHVTVLADIDFKKGACSSVRRQPINHALGQQ